MNSVLTRILPLYVMIVKLRQNFTKMREFSWIRDQKNYAKNIYRLRDMAMFPNVYRLRDMAMFPNVPKLAVFSTNC